MFDQGVTRETWSARYEQLRTGWLRQEGGWGQALFIRQGMAAWMAAWPMAHETPSPRLREPSVFETDSSAPVALSGELQRRLTRELANLILHRQQEVVA